MPDDRREGPDRREGERRVRSIPVAVERRSGRDRRWAIRRDSDIEAAIRKVLAIIRRAKRKTRKKSSRPLRSVKRRPHLRHRR